MPAATTTGELVVRVLRDLARHSPADLERWQQQVRSLGGCREPIRLTGSRLLVDQTTGEVLHAYSTEVEPHGHLLIRCGNRRETRCPACSTVYRRDAFHLVWAGLAGGKTVPDTVQTHPRVFATLTAPSFGPVHLGPDKAGRLRVCHPARKGLACWRKHKADDPLIGQPLDPRTYDYVGAVLWNAHAGKLWDRFMTYLRRELAKAAGLTLAEFTRRCRVAYAKVAEFQRRGLVHFHAVIRLDGRHPDDPEAILPAPAWATVALLEQAIRAAAARVEVSSPYSETFGVRRLRFGEQLDIRPITALGSGDITPERVAGYVAKYATKAAEAAGTLDRPIQARHLHRVTAIERTPDGITARVLEFIDPDRLPPGITDHALRMIATCWALGDRPEYADLHLKRWAHMLGFRGHFLTKARRYSTTLGALRAARIEHREQQTRERLGLPAEDESILVVAHWSLAGQGFTPGESILAAALAGDHTPTQPDPSPQEGERACA
ncbi:replication initiator [Carbonactinospora thermoautotrophica]|uniref:replication initiator n=1 Tax=Carbonactinospora thermoautotrophica TaxID=1469144 RepID=UPI003DA871DB